jgi:amidase
MAVTPPTKDQVAAMASGYGMTLDDRELHSYTELVGEFLGSYDAVEKLYAEIAEAPIEERSASRPDPAANPLNAWYVRTDIHGAAEGPLAGYRVAVKDNTAVAGVPMMNGSHTLEGFVPDRDATVVSRLLEAGATIAGKAVCEDLCFSGASHTSVTGPVRNPWDLTRSSGGSSSGSAALVASGEVDGATAADQGGSVRMPACFSGVVGHKPTYGLVPYTGAFPVEFTIDHVGPIARSVADVALMLSVMAGRDGWDPRQPSDLEVEDYVGSLGRDVSGMRVGVVAEGFDHPGISEVGVDETVKAAAESLREAGVEVADIEIPWHRLALDVWNVIATDGATVQMIDGEGYGHNWDGLYDPELVAFYGRKRREVVDGWSPTVKAVALTGRWSIDTLYTRHYAMARNLNYEVRRQYDRALSEFDALVMPTIPMIATPLVDDSDPIETSVSRALEVIVNTAPFDISGHPAISVPAGLVEGMPVGMMIVGKHFRDAECLRIAHAFEQIRGEFPQPPAASRATSLRY